MAEQFSTGMQHRIPPAALEQDLRATMADAEADGRDRHDPRHAHLHHGNGGHTIVSTNPIVIPGGGNPEVDVSSPAN
jgi:hypothetical protein